MTQKEIPFCSDPFTFLSHDPVRFLTCCPSWMHESRFIYEQPDNLWEIWNHPKLVEWRKCLLDGDYRYCQKCPNRFRERDRDHPLPDEKPVMERPPITYQFQDRATCNLACPSCRNHVTVEKEPAVYPPERILKTWPNIKTVAMSLSGDPFANKEQLTWLQSEPQGPSPDVIIWTNGILLPRYWETLKRHVTAVVMSVDACTKEVYEKLRRPAKWHQLIRSMNFIQRLVQSGKLNLWQLNVVVQSDNFRQLPEICEWGLEYGAHRIQFTPIAPWPHMMHWQWNYSNIANPNHPDFDEFCEVLRHPNLKMEGIDAGFISEGGLGIYANMPADINIWSSPNWDGKKPIVGEPWK